MTDTTHGADVAAADTAPLHLPHAAVECPKCFTELQRDRDWWLARPAGPRLVPHPVPHHLPPTPPARPPHPLLPGRFGGSPSPHPPLLPADSSPVPHPAHLPAPASRTRLPPPPRPRFPNQH